MNRQAIRRAIHTVGEGFTRDWLPNADCHLWGYRFLAIDARRRFDSRLEPMLRYIALPADAASKPVTLVLLKCHYDGAKF